MRKRRNNRRRNNHPRQPGVISQPGASSLKPTLAIVTKSSWTLKARTIKAEAESQLYPGDGVQGSGTLTYKLPDFNSQVPNYDQFRIDEIEVFATLRLPNVGSGAGLIDAFQSIEVFSSFDADSSANPLGWADFRDRSNVARIVLTPQRPMKKVCKFRPSVIFGTSASGSPSDFVWSGERWIDSAQRLNIVYGALQVVLQANNYNTSSANPFEVDFTAKAKYTYRYAL